MDSDEPDLDMKSDWNERARQDARFFIASAEGDSGEAFDVSGQRDVSLFFAGLEDLLGREKTVVDVGCGIGRMDRHVAPRVGKLIGIDVSGEMVARARERLADLSNVEFVEGDGWSLQPIADASIDLVFSHIVFQHVPRKVASSYYRDAFRILKPGGHFVFQMPEANADSPADPPESDTFEMRFYEETALREELAGVGFQWVDSLRHPVKSPTLDFDQLRVHVARPR